MRVAFVGPNFFMWQLRWFHFMKSQPPLNPEKNPIGKMTLFKKPFYGEWNGDEQFAQPLF